MTPHSGMIKDMAIPWLFQELMADRKTGTGIFGLDKIVKKVYMEKGEIIFASSSIIEDRLGECLVQTGVISREQRDTSLDEALHGGKKLGAVMIEKKIITPKQLVSAIKHQVVKITASIFNLAGGVYVFDECPLPDVIPIPLDTGKLILHSIQNVEWEIVRRSFSASVLKTAIRVAATMSCVFHNESLERDQQTMLSLVDGTKSVETLCNSSGLGDFNALKAIYVLLALKIAKLSETAGTAAQKT